MKVSSEVERVVRAKLQAVKVPDTSTKIGVSVRLAPDAVVTLDALAKLVGQSRTGLATDLLHAALLDAAEFHKN